MDRSIKMKEGEIVAVLCIHMQHGTMKSFAVVLDRVERERDGRNKRNHCSM
jgi:predicted transcriptional regulator YheO